VGIRALKAQLSKYVAKAVSGETIVVADRGKPVAVLGPLPPLYKAMEDLKSRGVIRWSGRKLKLRARKHWQPGDPDPGVARAVMEDRR
jgi:prevent-host-death family protein